jgi:ABC-2 type transport system ATP-binding protein
MNTEHPLKVQNLTKYFGTVKAVDGIEFTLNSGELCGLIGPNGAGKSTTFRSIVGLQVPDDGQIFVGGFDIQKNRTDALKQLGYVGQDLSHFEYLTGIETLHMIGQIHHINEITLKFRIEELMSVLRIEDTADRLVKHFSGGTQRKWAIASALLPHPRLILLDESFSGLDPESTVAIRDYLNNMRSSGSAVLLSSHVLDMLEKWVDRILIMKSGRLVEDLKGEALQSRIAVTGGSLNQLYLNTTQSP